MKLICGLGNPGEKYNLTRHNVGWHVMDALAQSLDCRIYVNRSGGLSGTAYLAGEKLLLVKPLTFMNLSGECLAPLAAYYKLAPQDILVICDDVNLPLGRLRIRLGGSAGGHNGLKNIIEKLGSQDFARIRVGVGQKPPEWDLADYVLAPMSKEEQELLRQTEARARDAARLFITDGPQAAMNRFNKAVEA